MGTRNGSTALCISGRDSCRKQHAMFLIKTAESDIFEPMGKAGDEIEIGQLLSDINAITLLR